MRKIIAVLFCALIIVSLLGVSVFAAEDTEAYIEDTAEENALAATNDEDAAYYTEEGTDEPLTVIAAEETSKSDNSSSVKAVAVAVLMAVGSGTGAVAMCIVAKKSADATARQPEAAGNIRTTMLMALVFIETAIIYALITAILLIFIL